MTTLFVFFCAVIGFTLPDRSNALGKDGLFCNMCNSFKDDQITACREPETYFSINCTSIIPLAQYCVIWNGNLTIVESSGLINQALGPRRSCLLDLDRYEVDPKNIKPGCFPAYVDKSNYLAYKHFHFDGQICLCNDEDHCNSGDTWVPKVRTRTSAGTVFSLSSSVLAVSVTALMAKPLLEA